MDSVDKRMHFFDRQFLRASDFQAEQDYHIDRRRRHNTGFHGSGVVEGLLVAPSEIANHVNIELGWAVDTSGREIVLVASRTVPTGGINVGIWMAYPDPEPLSDPSVDPGVAGNTRVHEEPVLRVVPPDPIPVHGILLATVSAQGVIDNTVRPLAGLKDGAVTEPMLADGVVSTRTLADDAVTGPKIADDTVQMGNLHPDLRSLIESGGISNDAIQSAMIAEADNTSGQDTSTGGGVKTGHLQNNAVTNAKVADNTLFYTKLQGGGSTFNNFPISGNTEAGLILGPAGRFFLASVEVVSGIPGAGVTWSFRASQDGEQTIIVRNFSGAEVMVKIRVLFFTEPS